MIRGKIESSREIRTRYITCGDTGAYRCPCCDKWIDSKTGEELITTTLGEISDEVLKCNHKIGDSHD
jgi:hypothetical protein